MKVKSLSRARLLATPWTAAYRAPPSMGFSRQEYWSGVSRKDHRLGIWGDEGKRRQSSDGGIQGEALVIYTTPTDLQTGTPRLLDMNIPSDSGRLLITHHLHVTLGKLLLPSVNLLPVSKIKGLGPPESTES